MSRIEEGVEAGVCGNEGRSECVHPTEHFKKSVIVSNM